MAAFACRIEGKALMYTFAQTFTEDTNKLGSFCLSETSSGSDAFALKTRAKKDGNDWIINGSKMWITNSYEAEIFLIFANVRQTASSNLL